MTFRFDMNFRQTVMDMRKKKMTVNDVALALDLHTSEQREAISKICQAKELRRYQFGIEVGAPVKAGPNRSQIRTA